MSSFNLHPEAYDDLDEIWEFIAADNQEAADRVREEIYGIIRSLVSFRIWGIVAPTSLHVLYFLSAAMTI